MAKAGITIAISGTYNGRALERAREDLQKMRISAVSEMGGAGSALVDFGAKAAEVGGSIHNVGYNMEQVGNKATTGITVPILAAAAACGSAAVNMDTSLTNVRKTVDGTEQQYNQLKDAAVDFSKTNAVSASQLLDIEALGAQLGYTLDTMGNGKTELQEFGEVVSGLDIATNMDAETAGTELAQFANITRMAKEDTSNYGSAIVALGNNMATTESDISAMSMRVAAAGTQANMSQPDILGFSAAMASLGIEAEAGGTAFSQWVSSIDAAVSSGGEDLQAYAAVAGMSADQFAESWRNSSTDTVQALLKGLSASDNMTVALESMGVTGVRQADVLKRLAGNTDLVSQALEVSNKGWSENTALQDEVANRNDSMAAKLEILKNKVTAAAEEIGTPLMDALLDVVDAAEPVIEGIGNAAEAFADMDEKDQRMILGLVAAAAAFGPVTSVTGKMAQGVGDLVVNVGKGAQKLGLLKSEMSLVQSATKAACGPTLSLGDAVTTLGAKQIPMLTTAMSVAKAAFIGLGIGAAVVAIGAVVTALKDVIGHEQKVVDATYGLETAMGSAAEAYGSYSSGADSAAKSLGSIKDKTDEVIDSQGKLAEEMSEKWADYGTNAAMVDAYASEIERLTQKYDENGNKVQLTAEEQQKLKLAVDGFNEATGSSVQVTDALNGKLDTSIGTIKANAEAWKEQARAQAATEMYKDLYKQQIQDEMALSDATATLTQLKQKEAEAWIYSTDGVNPYSAQVAEAQKNVDELTSALDSDKATQEQLIGVMMGAGAQFDSFDAALEGSGIALSDFGNISDEQLSALKDGFDGSLSSIVKTCNEQGIQIPQSLADAMNSNASVAADEASGLGADVDAGIKQGIEDNADEPKSGIEAVGQGIIDFFKNLFGIHSPSTVMAEFGAYIDLGLKQGIEENQGGPALAIGTLGQLVQLTISGLPGFMQGIGASAGSLLAGGISSLQGAVQEAGASLNASGQDGASPIAEAFSSIGTNAGSMLASGIESIADAAWSAGADLGSSAESGANPVVSGLQDIGSTAAWAFSRVIGGTSAYGDGWSLADSARDGMGDVDTYWAGWNFAEGFSNGMSGVDVWTAAWNIGVSALGAIKRALGIASPSKEAAKVGAFFGEGAIVGMKSTESAIEAESQRMSDAMSLNPTLPDGKYVSAAQYAGSPYSTGYQAQRSFTLNVSVNVTSNNVQEAAAIGKTIGDQLYLEFARRERAYA